MDHRQLEESIAAYALGSLDDVERGEVERMLVEHLPGCASCREMLSDFRELVADVALDAGPRQVPDAVEQRIMDRVRETPFAPQVTTAAVGRGGRGWRLGLVAAVVALAAGLGAWNVQLASSVSDARAEADAVVRALTFVSSPDTKAVRLGGTGRGSLVFLHRPGEAVLVGRDIDEPASGRVLQLWLIGPGGPSSMGVFRPDDGLVVLRLRNGALGYDSVAVTVERAPGARLPTTDPIFSAALTA